MFLPLPVKVHVTQRGMVITGTRHKQLTALDLDFDFWISGTGFKSNEAEGS